MGVTVDRGSIEAMLGEASIDLVTRLGDAFTDEVKARAPHRSGALIDSIVIGTPERAGTSVSLQVSVESEYALYQDEGTGIYGPRGEPIVAADYGHVAFGPIETPVSGLEFGEGFRKGSDIFIRVSRGTSPTRFWTLTVEHWPDIVAAV